MQKASDAHESSIGSDNSPTSSYSHTHSSNIVHTETITPQSSLRSSITVAPQEMSELSTNQQTDDIPSDAERCSSPPIDSIIQTGNYVAMVQSDRKVRNAKRRSTVPSTTPHSTPNFCFTSSVPHRTRFSSCHDPKSQSGIVPCTGYLNIFNKSTSRSKRYFVVLSGLELKYSKKPGHPPKSIAILQSFQEWPQIPHGLLLETPNTSFYASANSILDLNRWKNAIQSALDLATHSNIQTAYSCNSTHEGYLHRLCSNAKRKQWIKCYFQIQENGLLLCRDGASEEQQTPQSEVSNRTFISENDEQHSGNVTGISIAQDLEFGLCIELESKCVLVRAESYDDHMLWFTAISASLSSTRRVQRPGGVTGIKTSALDALKANHSGWMYKQSGILRQWKWMYFTLHGDELTCAKDANARLITCEKTAHVTEWEDDKLYGLKIECKSGRVFRVGLESYLSAQQWKKALMKACGCDSSQMHLKRSICIRKRRNEPCIFAGWLTEDKKRQFYVLEDCVLSSAGDVDHRFSPVGMVVDIEACKDLEFGMLLIFANRKKITFIADSIDAMRAWFECLKQGLSRT